MVTNTLPILQFTLLNNKSSFRIQVTCPTPVGWGLFSTQNLQTHHPAHMSSLAAEVEEETLGGPCPSLLPKRDYTTLSTTHWPKIVTQFLQHDNGVVKCHSPGCLKEENRHEEGPASLPQVRRASCHFLPGQFPELTEFHNQYVQAPILCRL